MLGHPALKFARDLVVITLLCNALSACGGQAAKNHEDLPGRGGTAPTSGGTSAVETGTSSVTGGRTDESSGGRSGRATGGDPSQPSAGDAAVAHAGTANIAGAAPRLQYSGCTCGSIDCGVCPVDNTVLVDAGDQNYRVDATEVTNQDYALFLAANPDIDAQANVCIWNGSFTPPNGWPATGAETLPVVWVDWCDAEAYCRWSKQRLCGRIGGGALAYDQSRNPNASQWYRACSSNATVAYPYGNDYDPVACNGQDRVSGEAVATPVGSLLGCQGGIAGLYDMSGNVWEWEDSCASVSGATDGCRLRGGSFWTASDLLDCPTATESYTRASMNRNIGFRCCSDP
jgi:formylglycine-generating enzyme